MKQTIRVRRDKSWATFECRRTQSGGRKRGIHSRRRGESVFSIRFHNECVHERREMCQLTNCTGKTWQDWDPRSDCASPKGVARHVHCQSRGEGRGEGLWQHNKLSTITRTFLQYGLGYNFMDAPISISPSLFPSLLGDSCWVISMQFVWVSRILMYKFVNLP